ncbi:MAG TPA: GNAT family N-acetyltransferase [Marmoricola sp.]|nr:GNAT family N-acetyltransferase [Marmoricola sp.]
MEPVLEFVDDPAAFLDVAGALLAERPVEATVVAGVTARMRADVEAGRPLPSGAPTWWLLVRDHSGRVAGAAMRTASFAPYPPYLLAMPDDTARALARTLHARGERVDGVNGALPAVEAFAAETARLTGGSHRVAEHTRLFELDSLVDPAEPPGRARLARPDEVDQVLAWYDAFGVDAAEQAGRSDPHPGPQEDRLSMLRRIEEGTVWVWEDESGAAVHLTGASAPMFGVSRIGPVYTPREHRGRGYAAATVAAASRHLLDSGARVCLFTDQANPVSNALYERLGFRPLVDQANVVIDPPSR